MQSELFSALSFAAILLVDIIGIDEKFRMAVKLV